uniref:Cell division protein n=1 Tax=Derbesia sp. WEST4838 TaxID=1847751 RepID=A0A1C9JBJ3_9CHLO|nr:cell division protein [Derbesia sp. WEST4838]AOP19216.1 cell division protein [Derbesia sp. WEST4838]
MVSLEKEINNLYSFITFTLLFYEFLQMSGIQSNHSNQLLLNKIKSNQQLVESKHYEFGLNKNFKNTLIFKQKVRTDNSINLPSKLKNSKRLRTKNAYFLDQINIQNYRVILRNKYSFSKLPFDSNFIFTTRLNFPTIELYRCKFKSNQFLVYPTLDLPIKFNQQSQYQRSISILHKKEIFFEEDYYVKKVHLNLNAQLISKITHLSSVKNIEGQIVQSSNRVQSSFRKFSDSRFLKKSNIFHSSKNSSFYELYEPISSKSYLIILSIGFSFFIINIFQNLYKEYGKEILSILVDVIQLIGLLEEDDWLREDLNLKVNKPKFRSLRKVNCSLGELAGIESVVIEISEIIWFLRNKKQINFNPFQHILTFKQKYSSPFALSHSYLFIGPPGTGKTLLVQAIAGESGVPILIQSGSILKNPDKHNKGAQALHSLFKKSKRIAPCIIFIDEIDGLGAKRQNISLTSNCEYDFMELIDTQLKSAFNQYDLENEIKREIDKGDGKDNLWIFQDEKQLIPFNVNQQTEKENTSRLENLAILIQLLIELDGLKPLNNILVIGATNRHSVLDPALLRPGRFNNFIHIHLPNLRKRIELFKIQIDKIGYESEILWSYLAKRTEGLSAADITAISNESALIAIEKNELHTFDSIEQGILRIITLPNNQNISFLITENNKIKETYYSIYNIFNQYHLDIYTNKLILNLPFPRNLNLHLSSYYSMASKNLFSLLFKYLPPESFLAIKERKKNYRYQKLDNILNSIKDDFSYKKKLEAKLIFLFAGKSSELMGNNISLIRQTDQINNPKLIFQLFELTDFGSFDLKQATLLIKYMVSKWYLYTEQVITEKYHRIDTKYDIIEYDSEELKLMKVIAEEISISISSNSDKTIELNQQKWLYNPWWQKNVQEQLDFIYSNEFEWYRIYLSDPDTSEQNIEWVPPDIYYYQLQEENSNPYFSWNQLLLSTQNYLWNSLALNAFNSAFSIVKYSVELNDIIINNLLLSESIREYELVKLIKTFYINFRNQFDLSNQAKIMGDQCIIRKSWGKQSRRPVAKQFFINQVQVEAKRQIEEAKQRAEEEAKQRAEEEAKQRAEEEID